MNPPRLCLPPIVVVIVCLAFSISVHGQWSRTAGSAGGFVADLLSTPDYMLIGMESGGVYRSTDDGATWQYASIGFTGLEPGGNAFAVLGTKVFVSTGFGVDVSVDQGQTWTPANNGLPPGGDYIVEFAVRGNKVYCGASNRGVYCSVDSGATWSRTPGTPADSNVSTIFSTDAYLYVGTYVGGVFRSSDGGVSWESASNGLASGDGMRILSFAAASGTLIVGTREGAYRSTDGGDTWTLATSGLTSVAVPTLIAVGPDFYAGTYSQGVYRSTNAGIDWASSSTGWPGGNVRAFCTRGSAIFGGNYGLNALYRSTDNGAHWSPFGTGITSELLYALAGNESRVFAGAYGGVHLTSDNGSTWTTPAALNGRTITSVFIRGAHVFAGTANTGPYVSTDNGETWIAADGGLPSGSSRRTAAFAADSAYLYVGTRGGVYRSTDNGTVWLAANSGLTDTIVYALCSANGLLFAGTNTGIYLSTTSGSSWIPLTNGLPSYKVTSIVYIGGAFLAAYGFGSTPSVYKSTDGGTSWAPVSSGLSADAVIQTFLVAGANLFGGTSWKGVWLSTDQGENWSDVSDGLSGPGLRISALASSGGHLFAGATKGGIWSRPLSQVVSVGSNASSERAENSRLEQNYPNPFNSTTRIQFAIVDPRRSRPMDAPPGTVGRGQWTIVKVYDVLGREVATLVNEVKEPGVYTVRWDARGVSSGVYMYRLEAGSSAQTKGMLLMK